MPAPAILAENLTKSFGDVHALRGVSLEVARGSVLGLLGPNGAGKTTAVRILTTLLRADSGRAEVLGMDLSTDAARIRSLIGLAGQNAALDDSLTGPENLRLVGRLTHMPADAITTRTEDLLTRFALVEAGDRLVRNYSGGMRRRLDLAAALMHGPPVLFLDEPTTGLDPQVRAEIHLLLEELKSERRTILLTTHYIEEAERLCDRVAIVDEGRIVAIDTPRKLQAQSRNASSIVVTCSRPFPKDRPTWAEATLAETDAAGTTLSVRSRRPAATLVDLIKWIDQQGLELTDVHLKQPTLEDVFIELTGKSLRE